MRARRVWAVSYTHLDVYKRQVHALERLGINTTAECMPDARPPGPVSYTHLDVYKRQKCAKQEDGDQDRGREWPGAEPAKLPFDR